MIDFQNTTFLKLRATDNKTYADFLLPLLIPQEQLLYTFQGIRDGIVFTNKRIITINVQGITGKKKDYTSLPYRTIQAFSIETAGVLDLDCELDLWFSALGQVRFEFTNNSDISGLSRLIAQNML